MAADTTDNDESSDESLEDILPHMGSHSEAVIVDFDDLSITYHDPPKTGFYGQRYVVAFTLVHAT